MTRGRIVNPLVTAQLAIAARAWRGQNVDRPVFIVGVGRSGTTLLGNILGIHRHVGFLNEPRAVWDVIEPNHDILGYQSFSGRYSLLASDVTTDVSTRARQSILLVLNRDSL